MTQQAGICHTKIENFLEHILDIILKSSKSFLMAAVCLTLIFLLKLLQDIYNLGDPKSMKIVTDIVIVIGFLGFFFGLLFLNYKDVFIEIFKKKKGKYGGNISASNK